VRLVTLPGVFRPISDSWMLADALKAQDLPPDAAVLDVCTGSGILAVTAACNGAREVVAVDVSRRAVLTAKLNARLNGVRVEGVRGDLLAGVAGRRFDAIVSNPPYVPSDSIPDRGAQRAWDAGPDGRVFLDRLIAEAPGHLKPGGVLLVTHSSLLGTDRTLELMRDAGLEPDVFDRRHGPLGPLMLAARERGLVPPDQRDEEVVIVRGLSPRSTSP